MTVEMATFMLDTCWCKACGICIEFCPQHVFGAEPESGVVRLERPEACTACRLCELLCPDFVITIEEIGDPGTAAA